MYTIGFIIKFCYLKLLVDCENEISILALSSTRRHAEQQKVSIKELRIRKQFDSIRSLIKQQTKTAVSEIRKI